MKKDLIRQKILNYLTAYQKNAGVLNGLVIIHDFVDYITDEPYVNAILEPHMGYVQEQMEILMQNPDISDNTNQVLNQELIDNLPIFKEELAIAQKAIKEDRPQDFKPRMAIPMHLLSLYLIYGMIKELKVNKSKELADLTCELSSLNLHYDLPGLNKGVVPSPAYYLVSMAVAAKLIIDNIDTENLLSSGKASKSLVFDKEVSTLYIKDKRVIIKRKSDAPIDHYILVALFNQEEQDGPIEFYKIAEDTMGEESYDKQKGWSKFRSACDRLNKKVDKATNGEIKDFIEYTTGKTGWCKINPKYL